MAINLSDLTGAATSADILAEVQSTADFLDSVPLLKNLADPSGATDAVQATATNQPTALPLIDNEGYLFCSGVTGNSATIPHDSSLNLTDQLEVVARLKYRSYSGADAQCIVCKWASGDFNFRFHTAGYLQVYYKDSSGVTQNATSDYTVYNNNISDGETIWVKMTIDATSTSTDIDFYTSKDNVKNEEDVTWTALGTTITITTNGGITSGTNPVSFGAFDNSGAINDDLATGAVLKANYKDTIGGSPVLDVDFTSPNVRHGATKFKCATGQVVTINQSGNDPATIIKKPVLRFDGVDDFMDGVFGQTVTGGYMFAAFSVLGGGGESYGNLFSVRKDLQPVGGIGSFTFFRDNVNNNIRLKYNNAGSVVVHQDIFDDTLGDILLESELQSGSQISKVNNANEDNGTTSFSGALSSVKFEISADTSGSTNTAIDLEYLALFPASITDEQADAVRNYINNRNNVFDLKDGFGYYFFDPQSLTTGAVTSWNGRIIGSDNGDVDKLATQATAADQPTSDGYKVTFADATDHLDIPSTTQAGWQVVGTSLGTFAYKVNANAVTELNLLGNVGDASYRKTGDVYGVILLPENATNRDINDARQLLIDRGASDGVNPTSLENFWRSRDDIVEFGLVDTSSVTTFSGAWFSCSFLTSFPLLDTSSGTNFVRAWRDCVSLASFPAIDVSSGTNFTQAWLGCSSLTSFPEIDVSSGTNFLQAWYYCSSLTSFPLLDTSSGTNFSYAWFRCSSLTSFPLIDASSGTTFFQAWRDCSSLASFPANFFDSWSPAVVFSGVFDVTWDGCTALTAQSVENILTSIAASGKYATATGASGGSALADATIDIDYNVATGSLTAATLTAIETLNGRGWSVNINNEIIVPNILQLQPAAAYSLRSFDADADPNVVNVRRSSDGATSDFTASEVGDGTLVAFVGAGNDGHVTTWYDQSSNGRDSSQSTASAQPKIVDAGTLVTDGSGNPAIIGDGVDDTLVHPTLTNELDSSDFLVTAAYKDQMAMGITGSIPRLYLTSSSIAYNTLGTVSYASQTGRNVMSFQVAGNTQEVFGNGASLGTASEAQVDIGQNMFNVLRGGSAFSGGPLMEVVVFGDNQVANRTGIEANINDTYTIY